MPTRRALPGDVLELFVLALAGEPGEARGADAAHHVQTANERASLWRGIADTLAPRVILQRTPVDDVTYRYTTIAQDFNLPENGFTTPCDAMTTTVRCSATR